MEDTDPVKPGYMTSTWSSRAQSSTPPHQSRPSTPISLESNSCKRRGWMASAGKRFRLGTTGLRNNSRLVDAVPTVPTATTSKLPSQDKQTHQTTHSSVVSKKDAQPEPPLPDSPLDKPLPSLPMVEVNHRSPLNRRSLIDATEQPLRRSVSPLPGTIMNQEWPTIYPSRNISPLQRLETTKKKGEDQACSLDVQNLPKTGDEPKYVSQFDERHVTEASIAAGFHLPSTTFEGFPEDETANSHIHNESPGAQDILANRSVEPGSMGRSAISKLPVILATRGQNSPRRQSAGALDQRRHTKTSVKRSRLSVDSSRTLGKFTAPDFADVDFQLNLKPSETLVPPQPAPKLGPVRSPFGSGRRITSQRSPYARVLRSQPKLVDIKQKSSGGFVKAEPSENRQSSTSLILSESNGPAKIIAAKEVKRLVGQNQRSSIPLPRKLARELPHDGSEAEVLGAKILKTIVVARGSGSEDADVDTDGDVKDDASHSSPNGSDTTLVQRRTDVCDPSRNPDFAERDFIITPTQNENFDEASAGLFDVESWPATQPGESGGYRIKRLSLLSPQHGPTLRISNTADHVIMGTREDEEVAGKLQETNRRRSSVPDLRRSVVIMEGLKKSTEGFLAGHHLPLSRSLTSRSLSPFTSERNTSMSNNPYRKKMRKSSMGRDSDGETPLLGNTKAALTVQESSLAQHNHEQARISIGEGSLGLAALEDKDYDGDESWISPLPKKSPAIPKTHQSTLQPSQSFRFGFDTHEPALGNLSQPSFNHSADGPQPDALLTSYPPRTSSLLYNHDRVINQSPSTVQGTVSDPAAQAVQSSIPNRFASAKSSLRSPILRSVCHSDTKSETLSNLRRQLESARTPYAAKLSVENPAPGHSASSKKVLSNFRGLFHKRSAENSLVSKRKDFSDSRSGNPLPPISPQALPNYSSVHNRYDLSRVVGTSRSPFSSSNSPKKETKPEIRQLTTCHHDVGTVTRIAMDILDAAKSEASSKKRAKLVDLGKVMVEAITASRDAELAMEEAKQAAAKAEIFALQTNKALKDLATLAESLSELC